jgi:hypothetical protein
MAPDVELRREAEIERIIADVPEELRRMLREVREDVEMVLRRENMLNERVWRLARKRFDLRFFPASVSMAIQRIKGDV